MAVTTELYTTGTEYVEEQCIVNDAGDDGKIAIVEYGAPDTAVYSDTYVLLDEMR